MSFFCTLNQVLRKLTKYTSDPGFNEETDLKMVRADIFHTQQLSFLSENFPTNVWGRSYDSGILTVTVNMNYFRNEFLHSKAALCRPKNFCTWDGDRL